MMHYFQAHPGRWPRLLHKWALALAAFLGLAAALQAQDGIFADFQTSMGSYTCKLYYVEAPKAVANFIGLATGQRAWLDLPTGRWRTNAFYDGIIFHRVIVDFMNQAGSPNQQGTDGPGYVFVDEFTPSLRHTNFGVLSMANSGPDSNGSQIFVTAAATPWLDDVHTIFGQVVGGSNVVWNINHVATVNSRPTTNVVIQKVGIRRVGAAAQAFNIHAQGLPVVTNAPVRITAGPAQVTLDFTNQAYADNRLYVSTNLTTWTSSELGIESASPLTNRLVLPRDTTRKFYSIPQIQYASSTLAPRAVTNRVLTLNFNGGVGTITITFNGSGGGTYTYPPNPAGTVISYAYDQEPYRGYLWPIQLSGFSALYVKLYFDTATAGTFAATQTLINWDFSGNFTLSP